MDQERQWDQDERFCTSAISRASRCSVDSTTRLLRKVSLLEMFGACAAPAKPQVNTPAWVVCMSCCADVEFRGLWRACGTVSFGGPLCAPPPLALLQSDRLQKSRICSAAVLTIGAVELGGAAPHSL